MWTLFNSSSLDISHPVTTQNYPKKVWVIHAGETVNIPGEVAKELIHIYGFIEVLKKDEIENPSIDKFSPPEDLSNVKNAEAYGFDYDRRLKHPTSNPNIVETVGFGPTQSQKSQAEGYSDRVGGIVGKNTVKEIAGKNQLVTIDKDGVDWYGEGATIDNPFAKE